MDPTRNTFLWITCLFLATSAFAQDPKEEIIAKIVGVQDASDLFSSLFLGGGDDRHTLEELMRRYNVPGVSIAVIKDFKVDWFKGYGVADVETGEPVTTKSLFQAASISKPVNAMAVLRAVQDGKFGLDDDIDTVLTSWKVPTNEFTRARDITPRMLMSHTSGTDDGFGFPGYHPSEPVPTLAQIMKGERPSNVGPVVVARLPFTRYKYSGGGVTMMQLALMDVVRKPYEEYLQEKVLKPIGMVSSTFQQPPHPKWEKHTTRAHDSKGRARDAKWHVYPEQAAAGMWTTAEDLCKFAIEVQLSLKGESNKVLSKELMREMVTPVGIGNYAVGFAILKKGEGWYFGHGGGNWGFNCHLLAHTVKGYGYAVMTNSDSGGRIVRILEERIATAYGSDSNAKPLRR